MGMRKERVDEGPAVNPDAWMVTFSDLICLMLTFFVLLLTMSSLDRKALKDVFSYLQQSTGLLEFSGYGEVEDLASFVQRYSESKNKLILKREQFVDLLESISSAKVLLDNGGSSIDNVKDVVDLTEDERGLVFSVQAQVLFESGDATIRKQNHKILDAIAAAIAACANDILVMGHTDDVPVKSNRYESNWELSVYRGLAVLNYFVADKKLPAFRFYAGGYGSSRPIHPGDDPGGKKTNRRVEIIFRHK